MIYRYARAKGVDHNDAEDVVQDVEVQFFNCIDTFEYDTSRGRFRGYLRAAVVHAILRQLRKKERQPKGLDPHTFDYLGASSEAQRDEGWKQEWQFYKLRWTLQSIASEFDEVTLKAFELHVLAACPVSETAKELGISIWRVYRAKNRVLARLKEKLDRLDPDD